MSTISQLLTQGELALKTVAERPRFEAALLLAFVLKKDRSYLIAWPEQVLDGLLEAAYLELIARRQQGEPVAYILGQREFYALDFIVTPDVLIPRPETELLVDLVLNEYKADTSLTIADIGTGSGAIAIALAKHRPSWKIYAIDLSEAALSIAQKNARLNEIQNIRFLHGDLLAPLPDEDFDVIISNPPYIDASDPHLAQGDLQHEPHSALVALSEGYDCLERLILQSPNHLKPGGRLLLEHGYTQDVRLRKHFEKNGYIKIETHQDFSGLPRITQGQKKLI